MSLEVLCCFIAVVITETEMGPVKKKKKNITVLIRGKIGETLNELGQF